MAVACGFALATPVVRAIDQGYVLGAAIEHSNNISLASRDEQSDWIYVLGGGFNYEEKSRNLDYRAQASGEYRHYQEQTYDDEVRALGNVGVTWKPFPDQAHWVVQDVFAPTADPKNKLTPSNIDTTNVFSTGPEFFIRLAPVHTLNVGGRWGDARSGTENIDNTFLYGYLRWLYRSGPLATWSLNHGRKTVDYKDDVDNEDFRQESDFIGYSYRSVWTQMTANYGYSVIHRERSDPVRARIGLFEWNRTVNPTSSFFFQALQDLSDAAADVIGQVESTVPRSVVETADTSDVFLLRRVAMRYAWDRHRGVGGSSIEAFWAKKEYETENENDEEDGGAVISFTFPFTATFYGTLTGLYVKKDFYSSDRIDRESGVRVGVGYRLTQRSTVGTWAQYRSVDSTDPDFSYNEGRFAVTYSYSTFAFQR